MEAEEVIPVPMNDAKTNDPRPTGMSWRYKNKDALSFPAAYFESLDELDERDRTGTVVSRTRERARGANRGAYLYKIRFDDPSIVIERIRAHGDKGVDAMASIIQLAGEGSEMDISDTKPHEESRGLGFSAVLRSKTTGFVVLQNALFWFQNKAFSGNSTSQHIENHGFSIQKTLFLVPHAHLKKAGFWDISEQASITWAGGEMIFKN